MSLTDVAGVRASVGAPARATNAKRRVLERVDGKMAQENLDEFFLDEDEGVFDPLADDFEPAQDGVDPD